MQTPQLKATQFFFKLVVGCTGAKKGSCFKFLRVPAYLMQYDLLSILILLLKSAKKWDSAVQKTKSDEGGLWGVLKMAIRTKYPILPHTVLILVLPFKSKLEKEGALHLTCACSLNWDFQCHYHLDQGFPTCGPRAACGARGNFVRPAKSYNIIGIR